MGDRLSDALEAVVERGQRLGFVGGGPAVEHLAHARRFAVVPPPGQALDLGSGGGLPGMVLACHWPDSQWVLLDASDRRTAFLEHAVAELDLADRVVVVCDRAERAARGPWRGTVDLVVARSFGPPAVTAECAAGFLRVGGHLVVSEPPDDDARRWPAVPLAALGLEDEGRHGVVRRLRQARAAPPAVPRRVGIPAKRPRW